MEITLNILVGLAAIVAILTFFGIKPNNLFQIDLMPNSQIWKLTIMLILVAAGYCSSIYAWYLITGLYQRNPYAEFQSARNMQGAMYSWGGGQFNIQPPAQPQGQVQIKVDGNAILAYKDKFKVAGIVFHNPGSTDEKDISDLNKSSMYDIIPKLSPV